MPGAGIVTGVGMVAGRPGQAEEDRTGALFDEVHTGDPRSGGKRGNPVGFVANLIVWMIDVGAAGEHRLLEAEHPALGVEGEQFGPLCRPGRPVTEAGGEEAGVQMVADHLQPFGSFRVVVAAGVVLAERGIGDNGDGGVVLHRFSAKRLGARFGRG